MTSRQPSATTDSAPPIAWTADLAAVDWAELSALYRAAPLGDKPPSALETAFTNSMYRCFAFDGARLVAAGRALADGADCAYLCDIAVLPSHQGHGLGRQVVTRLIELSRGHKKIILYAVPGKEPIYAKLGFRRMTTAMAIFADEQLAQRTGLIEPV